MLKLWSKGMQRLFESKGTDNRLSLYHIALHKLLKIKPIERSLALILSVISDELASMLSVHHLDLLILKK